MTTKRFKRDKVSDPVIDKNFQNLEASITSVAGNPLDGVLYIGPFAFTANVALTCSHGLGRAYTNIFPCVPTDGYAQFKQGTSPDRSKFVLITATANCTCGFLVF